MGTIDHQAAAVANAEAIEAWDSPLFDRFLRYRHVFVAGLSHYGDEAIRLNPPPVGARVLDVGSGFGDMTTQLAELVGDVIAPASTWIVSALAPVDTAL